MPTLKVNSWLGWRNFTVNTTVSSPVASCMIPYSCALACGPLTSFPSRLRLESCYASFAVFWLSPWRLARWLFGPQVIWSHVHRVSWLLSGFMIFFQSARWTYPESLLFSVDFLRKQWTPKSTCKSELVIYGGLVLVVRIINPYQH
jgi:hypothetical protein